MQDLDLFCRVPLTAVKLLLISSKKDNLICRLCKSCYKLNLEPTRVHVLHASV